MARETETAEEQVVGKESESSSFPLPVMASSLNRASACHSKWKGFSHSIPFHGSHARLLFGESVYIRNSKGKYLAIHITSNS